MGFIQNLRKNFVLQIILSAFAGVLLGVLFPDNQLEVMTHIAKMAIHWVKIIAGPFLFMSVFVALLQVQTNWSVGIKLIAIALLNTSLAIVIGISITKLLVMHSQFSFTFATTEITETPLETMSITNWLKTFSPDSLFLPLVKNEILLLALFALILGVATRQTFAQDPITVTQVTLGAEKIRMVIEQLLNWVLHLMPLAVFFVIAGAVSQHGFAVFSELLKYVAAVVLALLLQCILVYGGWILGIARMRWNDFWREAKTPVLYSLGVNSSLATLPLTLRALKNLHISDRSSSLGAGVATNLNNDGIVLYEASAVFFIAHLSGVDWSTGQMVLAALTCIVASMGITGVPEAGFISLTVVVSALGLPSEALPILLSVDWIMGRLRSGVNVLSDMTLSIALDTIAPPRKTP
ncbi:MAG: cation:dicarboxylase symporter family transporter [Bdellovibrionaceae bacterium]|nr:cation:dicarboxylase symporter family transporter [Pseudobdellovibrionaceae bacterium]